MPQLKNPRHELLAQARANGLEWVDCYKSAGYSGGHRQNVHKILTAHPEIHERVEELLEARATFQTTLHQYTKAEVVAGLIKNAKMGSTGWAVNNTKGEPTGNFKYDLQSSNRAWELLGMELGMFPKVSKNMHGKLDPLEGLQQEEVLKLTENVFNTLGVEIDMDMLQQVIAMREENPSLVEIPAHAAENGGEEDDD